LHQLYWGGKLELLFPPFFKMGITAWSDVDHLLSDQIMSERRRPIPLYVVSQRPAKEMTQIAYTVHRTAVHNATPPQPFSNFVWLLAVVDKSVGGK